MKTNAYRLTIMCTIQKFSGTFRSATYALSAVCAIFFLYSMGTTIWILWKYEFFSNYTETFLPKMVFCYSFCYSSRKASTTWSGSETASFPDRLEAANRTGNSTPAHRRQQNQNHNNNVPESAQTVFPNLLNTRPPYLLANTENSDEYAQAKPHPNPGEADDEDKERYEIPGADKFKARPPPLPPHAAKKPVKTNS